MTSTSPTLAGRTIDRERLQKIAETYKKKSQLKSIWHRFRKNKMAVFGLIVFLIMVLVALCAPLFLDYETDIIQQSILMKNDPPSLEHPFGMDLYGRDIFKRVLWGARISMSVGIVVVLISITIGTIFGSLAGFYGGILDDILMRIMDIMLNIPATLMAIAIVASFGNSIRNVIIALSIEQIPKMARIVRSQIITIKNGEFIEAAYACGTSDKRIIFRHILPNALSPIIVEATLTVARSIISIAGLSFIGMGIQPPDPEWGSMLSESKRYLRECPHLVIAPGLAIVLSVMSLTMIGDGLRDALDPKMKK